MFSPYSLPPINKTRPPVLKNFQFPLTVNNLSRKQKNTNVTLMILLIANSAFPYFFRPIEPIIISFLILILVWIKRGGNYRIDRRFLVLISLFTFIYLAKFLFGNVSLNVLLGAFLRIAYAFLFLKIIRNNFIESYIVSMFYITICSLIIYLIYLIDSSIISLFESLAKIVSDIFPFSQGSGYVNTKNILIFEYSQLPRNSGPFWEPGSFAGFSIIALFFNLIKHNTIFNKPGWIFIIGIITTLATTGYLALVIFVIYYVTIVKRLSLLKIMLIPAILVISLVVFSEVSFLKEKIISHSMEIQKGKKIKKDTRKTRFVSFILDFREAVKSPLLGVYKQDRDQKVILNKGGIDIIAHRTNGIGALLKRYGFIFFFLYFYLCYYSFKKILVCHRNNSNLSIFGVALVLLIGFSELYFGLIFFWCLPLSYLAYTIYRTNESSLVNQYSEQSHKIS
jgi:hypothetical protein